MSDQTCPDRIVRSSTRPGAGVLSALAGMLAKAVAARAALPRTVRTDPHLRRDLGLPPPARESARHAVDELLRRGFS